MITRLIKLGCLSLLATVPVAAQEEPAGELDNEDYGFGEAAPPAEGGESALADDTWDSYSDLQRVSSVAEDITDGVRVEDIVEPPSDYRYAAFGKPDPFIPPVVSTETQSDATTSVAGVDGPGAIEIPIVSPLQKFGLNQLRVVGIYSVSSGERKALVVAPNGRGIAVSVKIGDPIGNRGGKILAIGEKTVTVREFTLAADGTRQYDDLEMFLGQPDDRATGAKIRFEPGQSSTRIIENENVIQAIEENVETGNLGDANQVPGGAPVNPTPAGANQEIPLPKGAHPLMKDGQVMQPAGAASGQTAAGQPATGQPAAGQPTPSTAVPAQPVPVPNMGVGQPTPAGTVPGQANPPAPIAPVAAPEPGGLKPGTPAPGVGTSNPPPPPAPAGGGGYDDYDY